MKKKPSVLWPMTWKQKRWLALDICLANDKLKKGLKKFYWRYSVLPEIAKKYYGDERPIFCIETKDEIYQIVANDYEKD